MTYHYNDRGNKKWTSMMLPEHVVALRRLFAEKEQKEKPLLDEQRKTEINFLLQTALQNDTNVQIKYYTNETFKMAKGKLLRVDPLSGHLKIKHDKVEEIRLEDILDVANLEL